MAQKATPHHTAHKTNGMKWMTQSKREKKTDMNDISVVWMEKNG